MDLTLLVFLKELLIEGSDAKGGLQLSLIVVPPT